MDAGSAHGSPRSSWFRRRPSVEGRAVEWQFLGGVSAPYFEDATIEFFDADGDRPSRQGASSMVEGRLRTGTAGSPRRHPEFAPASSDVGRFGAARWGYETGGSTLRDATTSPAWQRCWRPSMISARTRTPVMWASS